MEGILEKRTKVMIAGGDFGETLKKGYPAKAKK